MLFFYSFFFYFKKVNEYTLLCKSSWNCSKLHLTMLFGMVICCVGISYYKFLDRSSIMTNDRPKRKIS